MKFPSHEESKQLLEKYNAELETLCAGLVKVEEEGVSPEDFAPQSMARLSLMHKALAYQLGIVEGLIIGLTSGSNESAKIKESFSKGRQEAFTQGFVASLGIEAADGNLN